MPLHWIYNQKELAEKGLSWKESAQDDFQANGITKLAAKTEEMVGILQSTQLSVLNSVLYAKVLSEVLLTNEHPSKVLTSLLTSSTLSDYERNIFSDDLAAVELREGESPWTAMKIKGSILTHHLKTGGSLRESLLSVTGLGADETTILDRLTHTQSASGVKAEVKKVVNAIGLSCALPGALVASLYIARVSSTFEEAVTSNIIAGGDNCSRAMVVGALFGAWSGDTSAVDRTEGQSLPSGWVEKVNADLWNEIREAADKIAGDNKSL
eukprot:gene27762-34530_t